VNRSYGAGYASALVVPKLKSDKAYKIGQFKGIPCPHQTGKVKSCKDCRLCLNSQKLFENRSIILFTPHGEHKQLALKALG
jgi:hypothetical protein